MNSPANTEVIAKNLTVDTVALKSLSSETLVRKLD